MMMLPTQPGTTNDGRELTAAQRGTLLEAIQRLGAPFDPESAQAGVIAGALRLTRAERAAIFRQEPERHRLTYVCGRNSNGDPLPEDAFHPLFNVVQDVVRLGHGLATDAWAATPLIQSDAVTGAVLVTGGKLTDEAAALLNAFAPHAAACLDTARRFARLNRQLALHENERAVLNLIENRLAEGLDVNQVLALTVEWAVRHTQARSGWIGLVHPEGHPRTVDVLARQGASGTRPLAQPEVRTDDDPVVRAGLEAEHSLAIAPASSVSPARIVAPLRYAGQLRALLVIERPTHAFSQASVSFLDRLTAVATLALETAQQRAAVRRAQAARADFVRTVTHEIRLPMTSIRGYADLLLANAAGPLTDQQRGFLSTISNNVARMAALVTDLSDIARIDSGRIKIDLHAVDVAAVIASTLSSLSKLSAPKRISVQVEAPVDLPSARCDPQRLAQVLIHLIGNAIRYSPEDSLVVVKVTALSTPSRLEITISDTGIGIAAEDQARLFTAFFRSDDPRVRQEPGWGLGLHLSNRLLEVLGGTLAVSSQLEQGTTATFTLPIDAL